MIRQGAVYWLHFGPPEGSAPAGRRPAAVVQQDCFNNSEISTVVVAAITRNLRLAGMPGNVRPRRGEGGLPKKSVVNVSQLRTVGRQELGERIGVLDAKRIRDILRGIALVVGTDQLSDPETPS